MRLFLHVEAQLSPFSDPELVAGASVSLDFFQQLGGLPHVRLGFGSHGLQLLRRLAQVEAFDLGVDSVQVLRRVPVGRRGGERAEALEVDLEAAVVQIGTGAAGAAVRALSRVQPLVELEVNKLSEAGRTQFALVRPLTRVQPLVGL